MELNDNKTLLPSKLKYSRSSYTLTLVILTTFLFILSTVFSYAFDVYLLEYNDLAHVKSMGYKNVINFTMVHNTIGPDFPLNLEQSGDKHVFVVNGAIKNLMQFHLVQEVASNNHQVIIVDDSLADSNNLKALGSDILFDKPLLEKRKEYLENLDGVTLIEGDGVCSIEGGISSIVPLDGSYVYMVYMPENEIVDKEHPVVDLACFSNLMSQLSKLDKKKSVAGAQFTYYIPNEMKSQYDVQSIASYFYHTQNYTSIQGVRLGDSSQKTNNLFDYAEVVFYSQYGLLEDTHMHDIVKQLFISKLVNSVISTGNSAGVCVDKSKVLCYAAYAPHVAKNMFRATVYAKHASADMNYDTDSTVTWNIPIDKSTLDRYAQTKLLDTIANAFEVEISIDNCDGDENYVPSQPFHYIDTSETSTQEESSVSSMQDTLSNDFAPLISAHTDRLLLALSKDKYKMKSLDNFAADGKDMILRHAQRALDSQVPDEDHVIMSCYFANKADPQRNMMLSKSNTKYIQKWHESIDALGLNAVIFHDGLDESVIELYTTDKIKFQKVVLGHRSTNDERFFMYYNYLRKNPNIKAVLMTDISDVVIKRNPFELLHIVGDKILAGADRGKFINHNGWILNRIDACLGRFMNNEEIVSFRRMYKVYNAGLLGGYTRTIIPFLNTMNKYLNEPSADHNCNMLIYNYVIHVHYNDLIYSGFPLNSEFFKHETDPTGIYVTHK